jgi:hypothetical protein
MMSPWLIQTCAQPPVKRPSIARRQQPCAKRQWTTHLLAHLAADVCQALLAVKAHRLKAPVTEHLGNLGILLAIFAEDKLSLVVVVLVLSSPPVLSSLDASS